MSSFLKKNAEAPEFTSALFLSFRFCRFFFLMLYTDIDCSNNIRLLIRRHAEKNGGRPVELVETVINITRLRVVSKD